MRSRTCRALRRRRRTRPLRRKPKMKRRWTRQINHGGKYVCFQKEGEKSAALLNTRPPFLKTQIARCAFAPNLGFESWGARVYFSKQPLARNCCLPHTTCVCSRRVVAWPPGGE